jgi:hypothetical protein
MDAEVPPPAGTDLTLGGVYMVPEFPPPAGTDLIPGGVNMGPEFPLQQALT